MPLVPYNLETLRRAAQHIGFTGQRRNRIACFSCPDIVATKNELEAIFGTRAVRELKYRPDSQGIIDWHKANGLPGVVDTWEFCSLFGWDMTAFDLHAARGQEVICDLNYPVPEEYWNQFDIVFDCISAQCFTPGAVLANAWRLLKADGIAIHCVPASRINHGYYAMSPILFQEFYEGNGGEILEQKLVVGVYEAKQVIEAEEARKIRLAPPDAWNLVMARKHGNTPPKTSFAMKKFTEFPDCKR